MQSGDIGSDSKKRKMRVKRHRDRPPEHHQKPSRNPVESGRTISDPQSTGFYQQKSGRNPVESGRTVGRDRTKGSISGRNPVESGRTISDPQSTEFYHQKSGRNPVDQMSQTRPNQTYRKNDSEDDYKEDYEEDYEEDSEEDSEDDYKEDSEDDYEEDSEDEKPQTYVLSKNQIRAYIWGRFESSPGITINEIKSEMDSANYVDLNGNEIILNVIRIHKKHFDHHQEKKRKINQDVFNLERNLNQLNDAEEKLEILQEDESYYDNYDQHQKGNQGMNQNPQTGSQEPAQQGAAPQVQQPAQQGTAPQVQQPAQQGAAPQVQQPAQQGSMTPQGEQSQQQPSKPPQEQPPLSPGQEYADQVKEEKKAEKEEKFVIPRRPTRLETLIENFDKAVAEKNTNKAGLFFEALEKELDKDDSGMSGNPLFNKLLNAIINEQIKPKKEDDVDKMLDRYAKFSSIIKESMPKDSGQGYSDAVETTRIVTDGITTGVKEIKETILKVSGTEEDVASQYGICPKCKKTVPADSISCPYCGIQFEQQQTPTQGQSQQSQPPPPQPQYYSPPPQYYSPPPGQYQQGYTPPPTTDTGPVSTSKDRSEHPQPQHNPPPESTPEQPHVEGVQKPVKINSKERKKIFKYAKKLANGILKDKDPKMAITTAWDWVDPEDKELFCLMHVLGSERLIMISQILEPQFPELKTYLAHICSPKGQQWIHQALEHIEVIAQKENYDVASERLKELLLKFEDRIGFPIHE